MTQKEMRECIKMAKRFSELYHKTGLIALSTGMNGEPRIHLTLEAFKDMYCDKTVLFNKHGEDDYEAYSIDDGVTVFALISIEDVEPKGERDE